ncbi:MAG: epimerase [Candidatus Solincola sediminis]|nr:MAG: epimerase [Candidatus Solincola sediminis]
MKKRVLLTGASGFIGRHAIEALMERDYEVHALDIKHGPGCEDSKQLIRHECDLLDPLQRRNLISDIKATHLLHFAWYTAHGKYWSSLENLRWLEASIDLIAEFAANGGSRAVIAGSCAEYDWKYGYCSETLTPMNPSTLYGACKHSLHEILEHASKELGISSAWGMVFFLYGPYENPKRIVPAVITSLLKNEPALCSHGQQIRDFLHVSDVADAFVAVLESGYIGSVNIASGNPVRLRDVIYRIAESMEKTDLVRLGAVEVSPDEPGMIVADTSRLKDIGWSAKYDLSAGLEQAIDWWRQYLDLG